MVRKGFDKRFPNRNSAAVKALSRNVRRLRKDKEWSQDKLAAEAGVEQNAISLIENARANPTLLAIESVADALDVRIAELLEAPVLSRKSPKDR